MNTLSVLLPVYNAAPYLSEAIESLLGQTRQADQIVIINDGSTDHSLEVIEQYRRGESRIQLISQDNSGVSSARNIGLSHCEGDYVALMDADDICQPNRFEVQLEAMDRKSLDLCGSWIRTFGSKVRDVRYPTSDTELKYNYLFLGRTIANPAAMIKRSIIGDLRYNERLIFAEDFGFFFSLLLANPTLRMGNIPQFLLNYRTHSAQASQRHAEKNQECLKLLFIEKFNEAGLAVTEQQFETHYRIWKSYQAVSHEQLAAYLPLMRELIGWIEQAPDAQAIANTYWNRLHKQHAALGKDTAQLIRSYSGEPQSLLQRLFRRFT
ncbi:glycosyltransferase family 2 protein [Pseudomonas sp. TTU2014-080ASC]|uniref:glycosyltransferase family 2 protein n=1 Tax=Pseudomonas sp. TTU2014-080ASC TaxID=1729724 RepID=UPI0007189FDD|nr:glycosyltransferase family 2 protein [Pseudomonas sp. TTU2014-080ASC]KRW57780.1 hypothetical protein AO726_19155 [Pseudomonas sp. TTU2014-080ASC]